MWKCFDSKKEFLICFDIWNWIWSLLKKKLFDAILFFEIIVHLAITPSQFLLSLFFHSLITLGSFAFRKMEFQDEEHSHRKITFPLRFLHIRRVCVWCAIQLFDISTIIFLTRWIFLRLYGTMEEILSFPQLSSGECLKWCCWCEC